MISPEKLSKALQALHQLILKSRTIAHANVGEDGELFKLLDNIEYLVAVMMEKEDSTEVYRKFLELVLKDVDCPGAVVAHREFDDPE